MDKVSLEWVVRRRARGGGENVADVALIFGGDGFKIRRGGIPGVASDRHDVDEVRRGLGFRVLGLGCAATAKERIEGPTK